MLLMRASERLITPALCRGCFLCTCRAGLPRDPPVAYHGKSWSRQHGVRSGHRFDGLGNVVVVVHVCGCGGGQCVVFVCRRWGEDGKERSGASEWKPRVLSAFRGGDPVVQRSGARALAALLCPRLHSPHIADMAAELRRGHAFVFRLRWPVVPIRLLVEGRAFLPCRLVREQCCPALVHFAWDLRVGIKKGRTEEG